MARRLYPLVVSLIGGIGLGLALMYLIGVGLAFVPGWERWAEFFVPIALVALLVPYVLLIAHLVLRNHVGRFLLNRQAFEEALEYSQRRRNSSLLRSRREVANHTVVEARAHMGLGDYEKARQLLEGDTPLPGSYAMEAQRWRFELALREDDREAAKTLGVEDPSSEKSAHGNLAALLACEAELALREGDLERYRDKMKEAMWEKASHPRTGLCRALAMVEYEEDDEASDEVLALLTLVEEPIGNEIPARRTEIQALSALVHWRRERKAKADALLEKAKGGPTDRWTDKVVEKVVSTING